MYGNSIVQSHRRGGVGWGLLRIMSTIASVSASTRMASVVSRDTLYGNSSHTLSDYVYGRLITISILSVD